MTDKFIVPEKMLEAACKVALNKGVPVYSNDVKAIIEAVLRWLSENPVVPSAQDMTAWPHVGQTVLLDFVDWFQRRMFLAQEPAVPVDEEKDRFRAALEKLAKLGNGDQYGNSEGNTVAQQALGVARWKVVGPAVLEAEKALQDLLLPSFSNAVQVVTGEPNTRTEAKYREAVIKAYRRGKGSDETGD